MAEDIRPKRVRGQQQTVQNKRSQDPVTIHSVKRQCDLEEDVCRYVFYEFSRVRDGCTQVASSFRRLIAKLNVINEFASFNIWLQTLCSCRLPEV